MTGRPIQTIVHRVAFRAFSSAALVLLGTSAAFAQLDPILFVKRMPPNVVVVFDTSFSMLDDGTGTYYDPHTYTATGNDPFGVSNNVQYRRKFVDLTFDSATTGVGRYTASDIRVSAQSGGGGFSSFYDPTRFEIAKKGLRQAVLENANLDTAGRPVRDTVGRTVRWGLVGLPQNSPAWASACDKPVTLPAGHPLSSAVESNQVCSGVGAGQFAIFTPSWNAVAPLYDVTKANYTATAPVYANPASTVDPVSGGINPAAVVYDYASAALESSSARTLKPAGADRPEYKDRPLTLALRAAYNLITGLTGDPACRNNVVVLVTGGKNDGPASYLTANPSSTEAAKFLNVGGRRVPIYVVAVKPLGSDEPALQDIADKSGGRYFRATTTAEVARAVNLAVQAGFSNSTDFDLGQPTEYLPVSPIVGTVNLDNARALDGSTVDVITRSDGTPIPQRSNMTLTAGFALGGSTAGPVGFDGRLRAFRTYRAQADSTKSIGFKFVKDDNFDPRLWPDVDGRPELANLARVPLDPDTRNVYTYVPGSGVVTFSLANLGLLSPYLGGADGAVLIPFVRSLPLGAIVGSTPALMDPPSLDPPPDSDYGHTDSVGTYAGDHKLRRSLIWFGGDDGMIHGIDARTGFEVWAFIPFNLLPKLRTLLDGQPVHQFDYFVDSSPKIAEVKMMFGGTHQWRSLLLIGEGPGGIFYQAFDVTEAGMGVAPDSDNHLAVVQTFTDPNRVRFLWAFPDYSHFDTSYTGTFSLSNADGTPKDGTPGQRIKVYGDLTASATAIERSVGFTWSDPAVGTLASDRSVNVAIMGSGYFPDIEHLLPNRASASVVRAGHALYLLNLQTGVPMGGGSVCNGTGCIDVGDNTSSEAPWKNALQADPTAASDPGNYVVKKAYMGDLDGKYWRFTFAANGAMSAGAILDPFSSNQITAQPIYNSSALLVIGTIEQYAFFSTGSDLLPPDTPGGTGPFQLYAIRDTGTATIQTGFPVALTWQDASSSGKKGGTTTPAAYERPSTSPSVAGDIVFFTTTTEYPANVCSGSSCDPATGGCGLVGNLYAFTYTGTAAYDTNGDGQLTTNSNRGGDDSTKIASVSGRATAPFIVDQHLYFATSGPGGPTLEVFGNPEDYNNGVGQVGVRILSWREIR